MNTGFCRALAFVAMAIALATASLALAKDAPIAATTITVYIEGHLASTLTKRINESHAKMERGGLRFADMAAHAENGDTQGVWVTYTKP